MPEQTLEYQVNQAIYRSIIDLHRPVAVRDWQLNFLGPNDAIFNYQDNEGKVNLSKDYFAPVSSHAGYGIYELRDRKEKTIGVAQSIYYKPCECGFPFDVKLKSNLGFSICPHCGLELQTLVQVQLAGSCGISVGEKVGQISPWTLAKI